MPICFLQKKRREKWARKQIFWRDNKPKVNPLGPFIMSLRNIDTIRWYSSKDTGIHSKYDSDTFHAKSLHFVIYCFFILFIVSVVVSPLSPTRYQVYTRYSSTMLIPGIRSIHFMSSHFVFVFVFSSHWSSPPLFCLSLSFNSIAATQINHWVTHYIPPPSHCASCLAS